MRKSFDSLSTIVAEQLKHDPLSGHLFIFTSKRRDRVKVLYYERGGLAIWYKRLEEGTFAAPQPSGDGQSVQLTAERTSADPVGRRSGRREAPKTLRAENCMKPSVRLIVHKWS